VIAPLAAEMEMGRFHRRRSSVNSGGARDFCPKIVLFEKLNIMLEFYVIFTRKIIKMPEFL